jgi:hypothetical protein
MVSVVACLALGLVLVAAAALKLAGGPAARAALATYGLVGRPASAAWAALIAAEAALGVAVGAGLGWAARAAALLAAGGALAQVGALAAGRAGAPCGCFGARGRVGNASVGRALALAAALALVPVLPRSAPTTDGWLAIGLGLAVAGIAALAVVVLALAREVGMLRLAMPQAGALEISHEGPEIGARLGLVGAAPGRLGLAVFTSEGCGVCRALGPAIARFGEHPSVVLRTFDEVADADAWAAADVPGSPFAVALDADGTVLAKGTFNTGAQLESVLAAAERRRGMVRA